MYNNRALCGCTKTGNYLEPPRTTQTTLCLEPAASQSHLVSGTSQSHLVSGTSQSHLVSGISQGQPETARDIPLCMEPPNATPNRSWGGGTRKRNPLCHRACCAGNNGHRNERKQKEQKRAGTSPNLPLTDNKW